MNSKRGGTILMGCELLKGKGKLYPKLKSASTKYKSEENRLNFYDEIERILKNLQPQACNHRQKLKVDFITLKMDPLRNQYQ